MTPAPAEEKAPTALPEPYAHTVEAIYTLYEGRKSAWEGWNLSLSAFGTECDRQVWYGWRWAYKPRAKEGRMARLLVTGDREETRMAQDLRDIGVELLDRNPETGRQWAVTAFGGHVQGRLDGIGRGFLEAPKTPHVVEFKTHSKKSFEELKKKGLKAAKPGHYWQVIGYLHLTGYSRGFYLAHCKDNDELFVDRVEADPVAGATLMARAERILRFAQPPARIVEDPTSKAAFVCRFCDAAHLCHQGAWSRPHCRTCLHSEAVVETGEWRCVRHERMVSIDEQKVGCSNHLFIPGLVPGEQVDVDQDAETISYRMADGSTWVDGPVGKGPQPAEVA
ncbi:MAG: oxidoreductase [Beijerinckiaceae bacterium]|nr:oxidoreductase [Beijerinckiaceae bacterium]